jgi:hypothetical protein
MDVFGAFQLCSIGIVAAPFTMKMTRYTHTGGRNIILTLTGLILAGLNPVPIQRERYLTRIPTQAYYPSSSNSLESHRPHARMMTMGTDYQQMRKISPMEMQRAVSFAAQRLVRLPECEEEPVTIYTSFLRHTD